jgi:hypothetical protein
MFQSSKEQIKNIVKFMEEKLKNISNDNKFNGFIIFLFHIFIQLISFYFLIFGKIGLIFYATIIIWILILFSNIYFRGCILTKIERHLWNTNDWSGPYFLYCQLLFPNISKTMIENLFICKIILIATIVFIRFLFRY